MSFFFFFFFEDYLLLGCFGTTRGGLWTTKTTRYLSLPPFGCLRSPPFTERSNFTLALYGGKWRNQRWRGCARVRRRAASCAASYSRSKNISLEDAAAGGAASCASKNCRGSCYAGQAMRLRSDQQRTTSNSFFFFNALLLTRNGHISTKLYWFVHRSAWGNVEQPATQAKPCGFVQTSAQPAAQLFNLYLNPSIFLSKIFVEKIENQENRFLAVVRTLGNQHTEDATAEILWIFKIVLLCFFFKMTGPPPKCSKCYHKNKYYAFKTYRTNFFFYMATRKYNFTSIFFTFFSDSLIFLKINQTYRALGLITEKASAGAGFPKLFG